MQKKVELYSANRKYSKIKFYSNVIIDLEFAAIRSPAAELTVESVIILGFDSCIVIY